MTFVIDFLSGWKDLITKVFSQEPLAGAIITLLAIGAFFLLEREVRPNKRATNIAIVLAGWAILTPLIGFVFKVVGGIGQAVTAAVGAFYGVYAKHPLVVLAIIAICLGAFFLPRIWPQRIRHRWLRGPMLLVGGLVAVLIVGPIADVVSLAIAKDAQAEQPNSTKTR